MPEKLSEEPGQEEVIGSIFKNPADLNLENSTPVAPEAEGGSFLNEHVKKQWGIDIEKDFANIKATEEIPQKLDEILKKLENKYKEIIQQSISIPNFDWDQLRKEKEGVADMVVAVSEQLMQDLNEQKRNSNIELQLQGKDIDQMKRTLSEMKAQAEKEDAAIAVLMSNLVTLKQIHKDDESMLPLLNEEQDMVNTKIDNNTRVKTSSRDLEVEIARLEELKKELEYSRTRKQREATEQAFERREKIIAQERERLANMLFTSLKELVGLTRDEFKHGDNSPKWQKFHDLDTGNASKELLREIYVTAQKSLDKYKNESVSSEIALNPEESKDVLSRVLAQIIGRFNYKEVGSVVQEKLKELIGDLEEYNKFVTDYAEKIQELENIQKIKSESEHPWTQDVLTKLSPYKETQNGLVFGCIDAVEFSKYITKLISIRDAQQKVLEYNQLGRLQKLFASEPDEETKQLATSGFTSPGSILERAERGHLRDLQKSDLQNPITSITLKSLLGQYSKTDILPENIYDSNSPLTKITEMPLTELKNQYGAWAAENPTQWPQDQIFYPQQFLQFFQIELTDEQKKLQKDLDESATKIRETYKQLR